MEPRWTLFLSRHLDAPWYRQRWQQELEPDAMPYGVEHLEGVRLALSSATPGRASRAITKVAGADVVHAWRNRRAILGADVVYSHTEQDHLAAALILALFGNRSTMLLGQTIWLFESKGRVARMHRRIARLLGRRVSVFVHNAVPNHRAGLKAFPRGIHEYVPFGVSDRFRSASWSAPPEPRLLSVGNDRSRDWGTLSSALRGLHLPIRIAARANLPDDLPVRPTADVAELVDAYATASVLVLPVVENLHASGITAALEAAAVGTPIVASRAGGLDDYFTDDEVVFVPPRDPAALAAAIESLVNDPEELGRRSRAVREAFDRNGYSNDGYWARISEVAARHRSASRDPRRS